MLQVLLSNQSVHVVTTRWFAVLEGTKPSKALLLRANSLQFVARPQSSSSSLLRLWCFLWWCLCFLLNWRSISRSSLSICLPSSMAARLSSFSFWCCPSIDVYTSMTKAIRMLMMTYVDMIINEMKNNTLTTRLSITKLNWSQMNYQLLNNYIENSVIRPERKSLKLSQM